MLGGSMDSDATHRGRRGPSDRGFRRGLRRNPRFRSRAPMSDPRPHINYLNIQALEPEDRNVNLRCKVLSEAVEDQGTRCFLVTVGDETGCMELLLSDSYYNNLVQVLKPGVSLEVSNGFVVMREEKFMALRTAQGGRVFLPQQEWTFTPNADNNVSKAEYELAS